MSNYRSKQTKSDELTSITRRVIRPAEPKDKHQEHAQLAQQPTKRSTASLDPEPVNRKSQKKKDGLVNLPEYDGVPEHDVVVVRRAADAGGRVL